MAWKPDEIKDLRQALGLNQAQFAKKLRTTRFQVSRWEKGKQKPTRFFERKLDELLLSTNSDAECDFVSPKPAPTLEGSLWQSKESIQWTPEAIKNFRRILGWTQDKLAEALQTSQDIISQWETGKYRPSEEHQHQLDQLATKLAKQEGKGQEKQVKRKSKKTLLMEELNLTEEEFEKYASEFAKNRWKYAQSPKDYVDWFTPYRIINEKPFYYRLSDVLILRNFIPEIRIATRAASTVNHVDIDLDNHKTMDTYAKKLNNLFLGQTMTLKSEESGHLTVLIRTLPYSPFGMHHLMERILWVHLGLKEKDGDLEIFPSKERARRLPMFNGHLLLEGDNLNPQSASVKEKIEIFFSLTPIALHEYVVPFEEYWDEIEIENRENILGGGASYTPRQMEWDFSLNHKESQSEFASRVYDLFTKGLTKPSSRHNAEKDFILHFYRCSISEEEAKELIEGWYRSGKTNGYSKEWEADEERVIKRMRRHVTTYYRWLKKKGIKRYGYSIDQEASLTYADVREIMEITYWDLKQAEFVFDLLTYAIKRREFKENLFISSRTWQSFKNGSQDRYVQRQRQAQEKGLIELKTPYQSRNVDPSLISRPNVYRINYEFKEGIEIGREKTLKQALADMYDKETLKQRFSYNVYRDIIGKKNDR